MIKMVGQKDMVATDDAPTYDAVRDILHVTLPVKKTGVYIADIEYVEIMKKA